MVSHFVSHSTSQNDKVQFDYLVVLDMSKLTRLFFYTYYFWVFLKLENPIK
jgi:hypothetical protein